MNKFYILSALALGLTFTSCSSDDDSSSDDSSDTCVTCTADATAALDILDGDGFDELLDQLEDVPGLDLDLVSDASEDLEGESTIEVCNVEGLAVVDGVETGLDFEEYIENFVGECE